LGYNTQAAVARKAPQPPLGYTPAADEPRQRVAAPTFGAKDHVVAGLLAIFLGALGIHKFYLGYNKAAFITLAVTVIGSILTFGLAVNVMGVLALIEGVIYLTKSQTEFEQIYVMNNKEWF
ncbi:MAG: TM2 domain-containing protein, partial [Eggerthellaceae bacterium]|nr:TM2 domain-containing protein [Eggerthellaceae bacterium]